MSLKQQIAYRLEKAWYGKSTLTPILLPLSWLFLGLVKLRRFLYRCRLLKSSKLSVPVIVVGNLTVGGTGKTPLVIWIANFLKQHGFKPGIISRGYGGRAAKWPQQVRPDADPAVVGDEALVIARQTNCPMAVGPARVDAGNALLKYADIDIIISDDGLQHYALQRDIEIAVIDGIRRFGNQHCLPAGPLREPVSRLEEIDIQVTNGTTMYDEHHMHYHADQAVNLLTSKTTALTSFHDQTIAAIAGIGHPDKFFNSLRGHGLRIETRAFPDHHMYTAEELAFDEEMVVLMTEKDAVKCQRFANNNWWYVPLAAELPEKFGNQLLSQLEKARG
jgi:tetraacyldisaccharide 4'-kinase